MKQQTYERALQMWPEWRKSVEKSRRELGYDPRWPDRKALDWIEANYVRAVQPLARSELHRLNLPQNLPNYWEDCLYCDYTRLDGSVDHQRIRRRRAVEELGQGR